MERRHRAQAQDGTPKTPDTSPKIYDREMVRGIIINTEGKILVVQKGPKSKTAHMWEFVGGSVIGSIPAKPTKLVRELIREAKEETTIVLKAEQISPIEQTFDYDRVHNGIASFGFVYVYIVRLDETQSTQRIKLNKKENLVDHRWITISELGEMHQGRAGDMMRISPNSEKIVAHLITNPQLLAA
ncbi:MAG: NUDIX hydrolase [Nanoarchaeota archaeon]|nr:NUDIX hydrolase [Nanoarchaeota archaeon]